MIVSGGHILAIDGVNHDFTLSGDGVKTPIGITEELLEKIRDVSGKLDTTAFESWSAQTEHWDVQEYSGGEGIKVENHLISVSAKYLTSGDLEPYATKADIEDEYSENGYYVEGALRYHSGVLYRAKVDIGSENTPAGPWDSTKWEVAKIGRIMASKDDVTAALGNIETLLAAI